MKAIKSINTTFITLLFFASFLIRALVFWGYLQHDNRYFQVDSKIYDEIAQNIVQGEGISRDDGTPNAYRVPGYSLFLATCYKLFGISHKSALWIQIIVSSCIPVLIYILALMLFPMQALIAKISGIVGMLHLGLVLYSGFLMTEALFIIFFLCFLLIYLRRFHYFFCRDEVEHDPTPETYGSVVLGWCPEPVCTSQAYINLEEHLDAIEYSQTQPGPYLACFGAGIIFGLASLVRPVGPYVILLSLLLLLFSREFMLSRLRKMVVLVMGWGIAVAPWLIRNYILFGHLFFHTLPGPHFLNLSASRVHAQVESTTYWQARSDLNHQARLLALNQEREQGEPLNKVAFSQLREKLAFNTFYAHPFLSLKVWGIDIMRTALSLYSAELLFLESGRKQIDYFAIDRSVTSFFTRYLWPPTKNIWLKLIIWFEILFSFLLWIGLAGGVVTLAYYWLTQGITSIRSHLCVWLRLLPFFTLLIVLGLSGGYARIRLPAEPLLIILVISFWVFVYKKMIQLKVW